MIESWSVYIILFLVISFGFYIERIDRRVRLISAKLGRLSLTFQKIENDLDAIQSSLLVIAQSNPDQEKKIALIRDRRPLVFRHIVESLPSSEEILRGLEWPDADVDPVFWKEGSLADRMRLPENLEDVRNPKAEE